LTGPPATIWEKEVEEGGGRRREGGQKEEERRSCREAYVCYRRGRGVEAMRKRIEKDCEGKGKIIKRRHESSKSK